MLFKKNYKLNVDNDNCEVKYHPSTMFPCKICTCINFQFCVGEETTYHLRVDLAGMVNNYVACAVRLA